MVIFSFEVVNDGPEDLFDLIELDFANLREKYQKMK